MWALFVTYGCCFGIEITIENIIVLYLLDYFDYFQQMDHGQALQMAGLLASFFGLMNIFARSLGGWLGDKCGNRWGLSGRVKWLFVALFCEGVALLFFSQATTLTLAIPLLVLFGLFVKMSNGATYAVVPFINRRALGRGGRHRRRGRKRRRGACRFPAQDRGAQLAHGACSFWVPSITACSFVSLAVNAPRRGRTASPACAAAPNLASAQRSPWGSSPDDFSRHDCNARIHARIARTSLSSATAWSASASASGSSSSTPSGAIRIVTFCEEPRAAYDRVGLTSFFAHRDAEKLMLARQEWYAENGVELHLGDRANAIDRKKRIVRSDKGVEIAYDYVVLATGSYPVRAAGAGRPTAGRVRLSHDRRSASGSSTTRRSRSAAP